MTTRSCLCLCLCLSALLGSACAAPFSPTLESLQQREPAPEWFRDAKVGIYFHWGVYSVPAFGNEWYPSSMYLKHTPEYRHHVETYGDPAKFGYHDFIPRFKAEKFDAGEWAELFEQAGARFAGPVAEHHDNFSMWDSKVTPWNSAAMGPKRDITGELEKAIRARGMKFVTTFHHEKAGIWQKKPGEWTGHFSGVKTNFPSVLEDPKLRVFYGDVPREDYLKSWKDKLVEVIDRYKPDLIWHDAWMDDIPPEVTYAYLAHYFNRAREWGREVVVTVKGLDLPRTIAVEDFEKGRADNLTPYPWLTDDTISKGSWCYTRDLQIKPADEVIDTMIDIVSKNGQLLLNISPKADGTIPEDQRAVLLELGAWLKANGEAIYATRPWETYGDGPTRMAKGGHFVGTVRYGPRDIRYTRSKDGKTLYAITLGWPEGPVTLPSVRVRGGDGSAALVAGNRPVRCEVDEAGRPVLHLPEGLNPGAVGQYAVAFRLKGFDLALHEDAAFGGPGSVTLAAEQATPDGDEPMLEEKVHGRKNIGAWNQGKDSIHWLMRVREPGTYRFRLEYALMAPSARIALEVGGRSVEAGLKGTGGWEKPALAPLGELAIDRPGIHHVVLRAVPGARWEPVNVWQVEASKK